jgi:hypothetical protein
VKELQSQYPSALVKTTGHSLGAALATLASMSLVKAGIPVAQMIHFGSPRVGNENFAKFVDNKLPMVMRHTHNKDIVPHNPPEMFPFGYRHISGEIFEDKDGQYHECEGNEDKSCADQYTIDVSISDHLVYLD